MPTFPLLLAAVVIATSVASAACDCSYETFEMTLGETRTFIVTGGDPTVDLDEGSVVIVHSQEIGVDLDALTLRCDSERCLGAVRGC